MLRIVALFALMLFGADSLVPADDDAPKVDNPHGALTDTCATCHGSEGWSPAKIAKTFDHGRFKFRLEGTHVQTSCRACHLTLVFAQADTACVSCHQDSHRGELGDDCGRCHTPRSFVDRQRMKRAHQMTRFPLTGAHAGADCEGCHRLRADLKYVNTATDCVSCHLQDYLATRNPDHTVLGYAQTCQDCHNTVAFRPAKAAGNHDALFFPIYSGRHRGVWSSCATCHVNPSNFAEFSCFLGCHTHADQANVTSQHVGISGFAYDSAACYGCHPSP